MRARLLAGVLALLAAVLAAPPAGLAQGLDKIGDEAPVGQNASGENCRVRLSRIIKEPIDYHVYHVHCEGWTAASGEITRFRIREATPDKLLTDSPWQKRFEQRLGHCGGVEPTEMLGVKTAVLRACHRDDGGWPVVVATATLQGRKAYTFETFPTNMRVLERAAEVLEGKRTFGEAAGQREGGQSGVIRRAEAMVGAGGKLIGVQDMGAADALWRLVKRYEHAGDFASAEAACRRLLEIHERLFGVSSPVSVQVLSELGLVLANQGRSEEATRVLDRAESQMRGPVRWDAPLVVLGYRAYVAMAERRPEQAVQYAQKALSLRKPRRGETYNLGFTYGTLGFAYRDAGKGDEAIDAAERSIHIMEKPGSNPEGRQFWVGQNYLTIGTVLRTQKKFAEAKASRLDADWVLLSACNTARADGKLAGESLSGLAQGFFYAGARALLASHWAVASRATVLLTTGMFSVYARDPAGGRAEALRRAQLALANEKDTSHPFFWAPFVLAGDGGPTGP